MNISGKLLMNSNKQCEITGYVHNVVFCCGAVPEDDGTIKIYWGGADSVMCLGTAILEELVDYCLNNPRKAL